MKTVIICGGTAPSRKLIEDSLIDCNYFICADSGANIAKEYDLYPNLIVGDMDSIRKDVLEYYSNKNVSIDIYPVSKDATDSEIALNKAIELGANEIIFLGCTGTRIDHLLGNLGLLKKCLGLGIHAILKDDNNTIFLINKNTILKNLIGTTFSLQSYGDVVQMLTIKGAKYELINYSLQLGDPRTISNQFNDTEVFISFDSGTLLISYSTN